MMQRFVQYISMFHQSSQCHTDGNGICFGKQSRIIFVDESKIDPHKSSRKIWAEFQLKIVYQEHSLCTLFTGIGLYMLTSVHCNKRPLGLPSLLFSLRLGDLVILVGNIICIRQRSALRIRFFLRSDFF